VTIQRDGRIVAAGTDAGANNLFLVARFNPDGSLDTSGLPVVGFSRRGWVTFGFGPNNNGVARGMVLQGDGKIVVVGYDGSGGTTHMVVARLNTDGTLDSTFGIAGEVVIDPNVGGFANAVALQTDGKILVAGALTVDANGTTDFAVARLNPDGTLDDGGPTDTTPGDSFGTNGIALAGFGFTDAAAKSVLIQSDGKIVAVGDVSSSGSGYALARFNTNGTLDTSFGTGGTVVTRNFGVQTAIASPRGAALQPDGRIVAAGIIFHPGPTNGDIALVRYDTSGNQDPTFGTNGVVVTDFGSDEDPHAVAIQGHGKIVIVGLQTHPGNTNSMVARYNADGTLDTRFGTNGVTFTDVAPNAGDGFNALALQPDGKIVAAGSADTNLSVARYFGDSGGPQIALQATSIHTVAGGAGAPIAPLLGGSAHPPFGSDPVTSVRASAGSDLQAMEVLIRRDANLAAVAALMAQRGSRNATHLRAAHEGTGRQLTFDGDLDQVVAHVLGIASRES
jgi:uncharacterized delta-60 repeat protein